MALIKHVRRMNKIAYFILIVFCLGHSLPEPEKYIPYDLAIKVCGVLYKHVNADSIYDAYSLIDWALIITITVALYILTMKLVGMKRKK